MDDLNGILQRKTTILTESEKRQLKDKKNREAKANKLRVNEIDEVMSLHIHESYWCESITMDVIRVYNGWIYRSYNSENGSYYNPVFVPDNRT